MQEIAQKIFESLKPNNSLKTLVQQNNLNFNGYHLVAIGKPASHFAKAIDESFELKSVLAVIKKGHAIEAKFDQWELDHPVVSKENLLKTEELRKYLSQFLSDAKILFLISVGASALLSSPKLNFEDFQKLWLEMLNNGWPIEEMNKIRILADHIKGGGLLKSVQSVKVTNLYVSDVPEDHFDLVSSSPTNTVALDKIEVRRLIEKLSNSKMKEDLCLILDSLQIEQRKTENYLLQSAQTLLESGAKVLKEYYPDYEVIIDDKVVSETPEQFMARLPILGKRKIFISVGETGIQVEKTSGLGGRNSHLVCLMGQVLKEKQSFACLASDGNDGNSPFAGGWVSNNLLGSQELNEAISAFDTANLLKENGLAFDFGPSATNLMDLRILIQD